MEFVMEDKKKKIKKLKRRSIARQIFRIILFSHFIALLMVIFVTRFYMLNETMSDANDIANVALEGSVQIIDDVISDLDKPMDENALSIVSDNLERLCETTDIDYMFLYTIDKEGAIHHLLCAAGNDEDEKIIQEKYGHGFVEKRDLYSTESLIYYGTPKDTDIGDNFDLVMNEQGIFFSFFQGVYGENGEIKGILRADYGVYRIIDVVFRKFAFYVVIIMVSFITTTILAVSLLRHRVVRPLKKVSKGMQLFTESKEIVSVEMKSKFLNEITDIRDSFDGMQKEITSYMDDIESLTREKVQTQTQMDIARRIQLGIVPEEMSFNRNGAFVYAASKPAIDVGGDFYDIFDLDGRNICVIEADISGKGISAALFMMMTRSMLREKIKSDKNISHALSQVNNDVCSSNPELMFATVFVLILDTLTGEIVYCNAGHNPPVLFAGDEVKELEVDPNVVVGFEGDSTFTSGSLKLKNGEGLYIYTDGVTEAINTSDEQFTIKRVEDTIKASSKESPELIIKTITDNLNDFAKGKDQFDDITQIAILYKDSGQASESI